MTRHWLSSLSCLAALLLLPGLANAHFLWLLSETSADKPTGTAHLYFGEAAEPDDPDLLDRIRNPQIVLLQKGGKTVKLASAKGEDSIVAKLPAAAISPSALLLSHRYGVISRGESTFLLVYHAKHHLAGPEDWSSLDSAKLLNLDIAPAWNEGQLTLQVNWKQSPAAKAQVKIEGPGIAAGIEGETTAKGTFTTQLKKPGLFSIRVRHIEEKKGELDGKKYDDIRHYSTLALRIPGKVAAKSAVAASASAKTYPDFPQPVTSFGAAIAGDFLYTYGGHMGRAHSYSIKGQSNVLRRLNLAAPKKWETLPSGPRLQGLAMVAHGGKLYRVGGFTAENKAGEDHKLRSQATVSRFNPDTKKWRDIAPLPEPRSSHDAAIVGHHLYVVGGWQLDGEGESNWHGTAWVMDLSAKSPTWSAIPNPPFQRRALALAAHEDKLYVIGGMQKKGGPATRVDAYDPAEEKWSQGPNILGKGFDGFACSAFEAKGKLYVSTIAGTLQQLSEDGKSWKTVQKLGRARFFHRMLPLGTDQLLFVGGANMAIGKFSEIDVVKVE